jgi:hypothetical protein
MLFFIISVRAGVPELTNSGVISFVSLSFYVSKSTEENTHFYLSFIQHATSPGPDVSIGVSDNDGYVSVLKFAGLVTSIVCHHTSVGSVVGFQGGLSPVRIIPVSTFGQP